MQFNYKQTYHLMRKFNELPKMEKEIIDYLMRVGMFYGSYKDLADMTRQDNNYIRKTILSMEEKGLIDVDRKMYEYECEKNLMQSCCLAYNWMDVLLYGKPSKDNAENKIVIEVGKTYMFKTTDTDLKKRNRQIVTVVRTLTEDEADIDDVGNMYKIRFADGYETDAFEDELVMRKEQS